MKINPDRKYSMKVLNEEKKLGYLSPNLEQLGTNFRATVQLDLQFLYKLMSGQAFFTDMVNDMDVLKANLIDYQMIYNVSIRLIRAKVKDQEKWVYEVTTTKFLETNVEETLTNMYGVVNVLQILDKRLQQKMRLLDGPKREPKRNDKAIKPKLLWLMKMYNRLKIAEGKCKVCKKEHDFNKICSDKTKHLPMYYCLIKTELVARPCTAKHIEFEV